MKAGRENDLGNDPIGRLLVRMAVPAIMAQLINVLYNIVDRMFIGQMPGNGATALTGLGVCFPIITLVSAFSMLIGMGGSTRAAISMGQGKRDTAEKILSNSFYILIAISVVLTTFFLIFKDPLLMLFGASEKTLPYASSYLTIYLIGTVFVQMALGLNPFITAQGFARTGMISVIIGAITNIILDPILIFGFNMGVEGAAIATIVSQAVSAIWIFLFLRGRRTNIRIRFSRFKVDWSLMGPVLALGLSPFIMQATESLVQITLNSGLQRYGGDVYVGAMTIINSVMMVMTMPISGLSQGAQPIVAFNFGAHKFDRVRKVFKLLVFSCLGFSFVIWMLIMLFPGIFIRIFNSDPELVSTTVWAIRIFFGTFVLMGAQLACQQTLLGIGAAKQSIFIALLRKVILLIPLALIFPLFWGPTGIFAAEPVADFISVTVCVSICTWKLKKALAEPVQPGETARASGKGV